jgi:8-oxo-dGTP pyrophosphatase MutT (NUDIX family)
MPAITGVMDAGPFSAGDLALRARGVMTLDHPTSAFDPDWLPERGDHNLAANLAPVDGRLHRRAAVLVPVVAHAGEASVLLTRRAAQLRDHSGQIAFPGGKIDESDADALAAALREAEEEIGLDRAFVEPLGYLDPYLSSTGFRIIPVLALVRPGFVLTPDPREVDITFEVPLSFLMRSENHHRHARDYKGALRHYYAMPYGDHYIWGVTAGILRNLYDRLYAP